MKSNAPWSVKGIERDARETAKEAARREGVTVGEWLSRMIYTSAEGGGELASGGEVQGLKLRDIVTAIEHLRNRVVEAETKNAASLSELTRNLGGFVERMQRLERSKPAEGSYPDLVARLDRVERAAGDRSRIEALKALEKAVSQVAVQFNNAQRTTLTRLDSAEQQLQEFAERIDRVGALDGDPAGVSALKSAIDSLAERVSRAERIAEEASNLKTAAAESTDPDFVEQTGARLRVLGDEIKRGGDQIRTLESAIEKLSGQIEAAEKRSADGVQKVADTIADVRAQMAAESDAAPAADFEAKLAETRSVTEQRLTSLQQALDDMNARFETLTAPQASEAVSGFAGAPGAEDGSPAPDTSLDAVADEIEAAVAGLNTDDEQGDAEPFAFTDDDAEDLGDDSARDDDGGDFSFQLDDDDSSEDGEDVAIRAEIEPEDDPVTDEERADAQSLLAEVRSALTGEGFSETKTAPEEDDGLSALFDEEREGETEGAAPAPDDEDDDEQAPNTASLADNMAIDTGDATGDEPANAAAAPPTKEDYLAAARRRAREAAALRAAGGEDTRPKRSQLTAKQRAILAARARQKRAAAAPEEDVATEQGEQILPAPHSAEMESSSPAPEDSDEASNGRFGKIASALSSARARLGRKKDDEQGDTPDDSAEASADEKDIGDPSARRNGDRAAFETLKSTASARPLTLALGVGIVLSIAALVYLVKDFIFPPEGASSERPAVITLSPQPATDAQTDAVSDDLVEIPEAPTLDPQALYVESIDALSAATTDDEALSAIARLQDAAALGYPPAQLQLGELYKTGQGVEQDMGQARVWFRRAANGGNVLAMHRIGVMTARGDGGAADPQEAISWFELAANYGLVDSQFNLGAIYQPSENGASAVQDAGKSYYWYALAARNGDDQAEPFAAGVAAALTPEARAEIDARVAAWAATPPDEEANDNALAE